MYKLDASWTNNVMSTCKDRMPYYSVQHAFKDGDSRGFEAWNRWFSSVEMLGSRISSFRRPR